MYQLVNVKNLGAIALAAVLTTATSAGAAGFFQSTSVEGEIGADVGGIWLGLYYIAPTFRLRVNLDEDKSETFEVGPVPADLKPLLGESGAGVVMLDTVSSEQTRGAILYRGDVITSVNGESVRGGVDGFKKALDALADDWTMIQILRPSLRQNIANIVKIQYSAKVGEVDGVSAISQEIVRVTHLDGVLPFADKLEKARQNREFYTPSEAEIEYLREEWYRLAPPERPIFVGGEHRIVAAEEYDLALRKDDSLRGSLFAIVSTLKGNPATGGGSTIAIYGVRSVGSDSLSGSYVQSSLASAPFPISIDFVGGFQMIKLEEFSMKDAEHRNTMADRDAGLDKEADLSAIELGSDPTNK
jgi:hypothetical protein